MAELFLARASGVQGFEKYVVVKQILPQYAEDPRFVQMFLDEARLAARLHHQNIGQVYDIGESDGAYFFAMEYLHGEDVRAILHAAFERGEGVPMECAIAITAGAAAGLHYAHELADSAGNPLHLVHRDVSPSNIIVTYDGGVKLVDFGIARAASRTSETREGGLKGKLAYMSPEQCLSHEVDRRSDIFSLGILLYELSTGRRLFRLAAEDGDYAIMNRIVNGLIIRPSEVIAGYPPDLEEIVMHALERQPGDRYPSAHEMQVDLEAFARQERLAVSPLSLAGYVKHLLGTRPEPWRAQSDEEIPTDVMPEDEMEAVIEAAREEARGAADTEKTGVLPDETEDDSLEDADTFTPIPPDEEIPTTEMPLRRVLPLVADPTAQAKRAPEPEPAPPVDDGVDVDFDETQDGAGAAQPPRDVAPLGMPALPEPPTLRPRRRVHWLVWVILAFLAGGAAGLIALEIQERQSRSVVDRER